MLFKSSILVETHVRNIEASCETVLKTNDLDA